MKIAISGKGGTGKSTIAGLLCHFFSRKGYKVLAVDADPDANLIYSIGVPEPLASSVIPISEQRRLIKERTGANPRQFGQLFKLNPTVDDIPDKYCLEYKGIKILVMGGIRRGGEGCACPENVLLRSLLSEIILRRKEVVVVDMEAGIEHLGRATAQAIDRMIIIVETGSRSINTALSIIKLAKDIGIKKFGIIGNKIKNESQVEWINQHFPQDFVLGHVSFHEIIQEADAKRIPLIEAMNSKLKEEIEGIFIKLISMS